MKRGKTLRQQFNQWRRKQLLYFPEFDEKIYVVKNYVIEVVKSDLFNIYPDKKIFYISLYIFEKGRFRRFIRSDLPYGKVWDGDYKSKVKIIKENLLSIPIRV